MRLCDHFARNPIERCVWWTFCGGWCDTFLHPFCPKPHGPLCVVYGLGWMVCYGFATILSEAPVNAVCAVHGVLRAWIRLYKHSV